jgi:hypothetical protein
MNQSIDQEKTQKILTKIFSSKHFSSEFDRKFLQYLIDATRQNKILKEIDIATDLFERTNDFNPAEDSIVRSHMYSLRKKLETYYLSDGRDDKIYLILPKGQYKVEFMSKANQKESKTKRKPMFVFFSAFTIVLIFITIYFWQKNIVLQNELNSTNNAFVDNPIWSDFIQSDLSTILVIGDYFVFEEPHEVMGRERFIRDVEINSTDDFINYLEQNPDEKGKVTETPLTYLGTEVPQVVRWMSKIFKASENKLKIKLGSDLLWQDIQENNIIFVGSVKTLRQMSYILKQLRFKPSLFPHKIYYTPAHTDTIETISLESYYRHGFHNDFSIVAKVPNSNNNLIMLIVSFSSFGKIETVKKLTSASFQTELSKSKFNLSNIPPFFEILFKVYGVEKSGFNTEILHFHEIIPEELKVNHDKRLQSSETGVFMQKK